MTKPKVCFHGYYAHADWAQQEFANLKSELATLRNTVERQSEDQGWTMMFEHVEKLKHVETTASNIFKMKMPGFGPSSYAGERARRSSDETGRSCRKAACWFGSSSGAFGFAMVCMFPRHIIPTGFAILYHSASHPHR